jgi:hypothetical protein
MAAQQFLHTALKSGVSRTAAQAAHGGANSTDSTALAAVVIRELGFGIRSVTLITAPVT